MIALVFLVVVVSAWLTGRMLAGVVTTRAENRRQAALTEGRGW